MDSPYNIHFYKGMHVFSLVRTFSYLICYSLGFMAGTDVWDTNLEIVVNWIDRVMNSIQKSQQALQGDAISEQVIDMNYKTYGCSKSEFY